MDPREITPDGTGRTVPAGRKEEALWLLERLVPGSNVNNVPGATVRVEGRLDPDLLVASVRALLRRHPVMRTVFHAEGTRLTKEVLPADEARLPLESRQVAEDELDSELREFVVRPFTLDGTPLVRLACFSTKSADVLCLAVHHLVFDNTSSIVFLEELAAVYDLAAAGQDLETAPVEEVAAWQEHVPDGSSLLWWREHLDGLDPDSGELWLGSRPAGSGTLAGASVVHDLSAPAAAVLKGARRSLKAPDAVVMLAASYLLLARHGAGPDFAVGLPVNIRSQAASRTIGYHVNILPLRVRVDPALSFREFTLRVRNLFMDAVAHADAPVDVLLPQAPRIGATWRSALFRHVFNFLPGRGTDTYRIGGMDGRLEIVETGSSKFDIEFLVVPLGEGYRVKAIHSTDVHTAAEVEALLRRYDALLTALGAEPDRPVGEVLAWPDADRAAVAAAHSPAPQAPDVVTAVARHAAAAPHAVAVREPHRTTDYGQLWRAAEAVRASLAHRGVGAEDVVGLRGPAGAELVAAALGVWLAGAAWTGAAPDATAEELAQAQVKAVVGDGPGDLPLVDPHTAPPAEHITGSPEPGRAALVLTGGAADGPRLTHRDLAVQLAWLGEALGEPGRPLDAVARAPLGSAAALAEVWLPLATGGQVVRADDDRTLPGTLEAAPGALLRTSGAQAWTLLERVEARLEGRPVLVGPDALTEPVTRRLVAAGARVYAARADGGGWWAGAPVTGRTVPALRPLPGTRASVAAPDGAELPVGVRGVVRVGARDTGVVGRWTGEGTLELLGAASRRLRRRGGEVRPEEVESLLAGHPAVSAAAVVPVGAADGDGPELVAVVARAGALRNDDAKLLRELAEAAEARLPGAALPDRYAVVAALPVTADGLLDLAAVTALAGRADGGADAGADGAAAGYLPGLVALWRELIGRDDLDADANFFTSGGHSLLAAQLVQRVEERTGVKLKLADAFEHPTPARLADRLAAVAGA
ncbi:condensation domain-containing protein [Streptomyces sp. HPF1205]|uniref:condensation domain-containing protein n=1 Tax=Streptomyces sp. HPF1205 TaxID=2873262 RepID=UPI001CED18D6|nr:condensation domain-containing protein [Streptomyces sp. HPF1205]